MTNLRPGAKAPDMDARSRISNASSSSRFATESKQRLARFAAAIAANDYPLNINASATAVEVPGIRQKASR
ncbi:MAG TPA: hypothetical protein VH497_20510 [Vicinamibacterales bacterium]